MSSDVEELEGPGFGEGGGGADSADDAGGDEEGLTKDGSAVVGRGRRAVGVVPLAQS